MRLPVRLIAALAVVALCAPTIWLRSEVSRERPKAIALAQVSGPQTTGVPGWSLEGVWQYSSAPTLRFGGFSGLLALSQGRLRAFSDRGLVFTFIEPDRAEEEPAKRLTAGLPLIDPALLPVLWDMESVTRDPETGDYWVGYEGTHAIHRFSYKTDPEAVRLLGDEVNWYDNGGLEAMERLSDGRFLIVPEGQSQALIFEGDPVEGGDATLIPYASPASGYAATDLAQLPDGRILVLMRRLAFDYPPFAGLLAIADPPAKGSNEPWAPQVIMRFDGLLPAENYEGLAVRPIEDGRLAVWIISDDNIAALQRTLLAKMIFDPTVLK